MISPLPLKRVFDGAYYGGFRGWINGVFFVGAMYWVVGPP
jgi:hypothetical protein